MKQSKDHDALKALMKKNSVSTDKATTENPLPRTKTPAGEGSLSDKAKERFLGATDNKIIRATIAIKESDKARMMAIQGAALAKGFKLNDSQVVRLILRAIKPESISGAEYQAILNDDGRKSS